MKDLVYRLSIALSKEDCNQILIVLKTYLVYEGWAKYHSAGWIMAGTNKAFSDRSVDEWEMIAKNSNHVESAHRQANSLGRDLTVAQAVET